ncbi:unnamed protein product [Acanthoscelides obtectus]|uniref:Uncharacterized protein n=1 Tax=Acanthoscelides obtectus TaxID=200917 RepID=A0A9P0LR92_ACAOB|nr:unnamed protein product [Acanthoscelides obtectus]CAK1648521.1 hypothetical protein AOBTE_LOCUS15741 [Acanthoscelides obtectus]
MELESESLTYTRSLSAIPASTNTSSTELPSEVLLAPSLLEKTFTVCGSSTQGHPFLTKLSTSESTESEDGHTLLLWFLPQRKQPGERPDDVNGCSCGNAMFELLPPLLRVPPWLRCAAGFHIEYTSISLRNSAMSTNLEIKSEMSLSGNHTAIVCIVRLDYKCTLLTRPLLHDY